ncbi:MAG: TonB-dependent receptor [Pseudomonadota bacterium]
MAFRNILRAVAVSACLVPAAKAQESAQSIDIPAQTLSAALGELAEETGLQVSAETALVAGRRSPAVRGVMTPAEALSRLLSGSGLSFESLGSDGVVLVAAPAPVEGVEGEVVLDGITVIGTGPSTLLGGETETVRSFGADEIERRNINNTTEALQFTPNVNVTTGVNPSGAFVSIRGLSDQGNADSTGASVGFFVNGGLVNASGGTNLGTNPALIDVEQLDVRLGPQTTAFGRSTTVGAVNVITKRPTETSEYSLETEVGSFPDARFTAVANEPLLPDGLLSGRLVAFGGISDGFVEFFEPTGPDQVGTRNAGFRLSLRSNPMPDLTLDGLFGYSRDAFDGANLSTIASLSDDDFINFSSFLGENSFTQITSQIEARYETEVGDFVSQTHYNRSLLDNLEDADLTPFDISVAKIRLRNETFSQDLRFDGEPFSIEELPGTLDLNLGTNISFSIADTEDITPLGDDAIIFAALETPALIPLIAGVIGLPPDSEATDLFSDGSGFNLFIDQRVLSIGLFGDATWKPTEKLEFNAGGRFSFDRVSDRTEVFITPVIAQLSGAFTSDQSVDEDISFFSFTPRASVKYDWTDTFSTYFAFSTGFRPGGVTSTIAGITTFDEERITSFEGGFRASFFDGRAQISGSGFLIDYDDLQTVVTDTVGGVAGISFLTNAGSARSIGGELGILVEPIDGLSLQAQTGVTFATFQDFTVIPLSEEDPIDFAGFPLPSAPKHTLTVAGEYEHPNELIPGVRGFIGADYNFRTSFVGSISTDPEVLDGFDTFNLRLGLRGERFTLTGFVENLFDERYATDQFASGLGGVTVPASVAIPPGLEDDIIVAGPPRRFGITAKIKF